ncbi:hypothetical protein AAC387_Pa01g2631 [Persea americana]
MIIQRIIRVVGGGGQMFYEESPLFHGVHDPRAPHVHLAHAGDDLPPPALHGHGSAGDPVESEEADARQTKRVRKLVHVSSL